MRIILLFLLGTISFSASAQWYRVDLQFKKHERFPLLTQVTDHSVKRFHIAPIEKTKIHSINLERYDFGSDTLEAEIMKTAKHNMRFRIYADASYNFNELARLYIRQRRYSEAKWFLLQSNTISRQLKDDRLTIANLMDLATIKADIGDYVLAQADLTEAHDIALVNGYRDDLKTIEKEIQYIKQNKQSVPKPELRYAEAAQNSGKAQ